jgi:glycogen debranching enzyme
MLTSRLLAFALFFASLLTAAPLELSRPVKPWEFLDAVGQQSSLLGREDGTLEAYVYPLKIFSDLQFSFEVGGRVIPGSAIARRVVFRPGSTSIIYSGDEFQVEEALIVPVNAAGGLIRLKIRASDPVTIRFSLRRDFQLMWPASFGSAYGVWDPKTKTYRFGADGQPYSAVLGSSDLNLTSSDYATDYSAQVPTEFSLGTISGTGIRTLGFAGSVHSQDEAMTVYNRLVSTASQVEADNESYYGEYMAHTASVELPDKQLQEAYDWSRLSLVKTLVRNPLLGEGLVAGYGPSKGGYRPGYAWFFGRDSFWSSFALNSEGDSKSSRTAIDFIARFQRDDGKIPHEISQSASLVPWTKDYPYEYASADGTPLFIIAVRDYVQRSGDSAFARSMWERLSKAMAFSRSTFDANGFPKNIGVGHGWVEGGPLLPVREEFYLAGCYVEAVRSFAQLARWTGHNGEAITLEQEFDEKVRKLNDLFWLADSGNYAYAIGTDSRPVNQPTVLALVPEWWSLLLPDRVQSMTEHLAEEDHAADWGMRIISSKAATYNPAGYHFGSVWPLFTGWASLGEYHAHEAAPAFANLKANSWLALDGDQGNTTEVVSGETYSPLSTSSPHQTWSAAMVIAPLLRGVFGLEVDSMAKRVTLRPHFPGDWDHAALRNVAFNGGTVDFLFKRDAAEMSLRVDNHGASGFMLDYAPAYSPATSVSAVTVNGEPAKFTRQEHVTDWHPTIGTAILNTGTTISFKHERLFNVAVPAPPPQLAEPSSNLKLISEKWENANNRVTLTFSGLGGRTYDFYVTGAESISMLTGAQQDGGRLRVIIPPANGYTHATVRMELKPPAPEARLKK